MLELEKYETRIYNSQHELKNNRYIKKRVTVTKLLDLMGYHNSHFKLFTNDDSCEAVKTKPLPDFIKKDEETEEKRLHKIIENYTDVARFITRNLGIIILGFEVELCANRVYKGYVHIKDHTKRLRYYRLEGRIDVIGYNSKTGKYCVLDFKSVNVDKDSKFNLGDRTTKNRYVNQVKLYSRMLQEVLHLGYKPEGYLLGFDYGDDPKITAWKVDVEGKLTFRDGSKEGEECWAHIKKRKNYFKKLEEENKKKESDTSMSANYVVIDTDKIIKNMENLKIKN